MVLKRMDDLMTDDVIGLAKTRIERQDDPPLHPFGDPPILSPSMPPTTLVCSNAAWLGYRIRGCRLES